MTRDRLARTALALFNLLALVAIALMLMSLAAPPAWGQQSGAAEKRPTCATGRPLQYTITNASSATDCDQTGGGSTEARCCCLNGTWAACASAGGGSAITLDLADDSSNESSDLVEIATIRDRYGVATEPTSDKLLLDFSRLGDRYLAGPPASPGTPDDEFGSGTLNVKWTAVEGGSGTVDLWENSNVEEYDLTTRPGWLLMQAGRATTQNVQLRQDYTLGDGDAIIARFAPAIQGSGVNNHFQCSLALNDSDTSYVSGTWAYIAQDSQNGGGIRLLMYSGTGAGAERGTTLDMLPGDVWVGYRRSGTDYTSFVSLNGGDSFIVMGTASHGVAFDNVWLSCNTSATQSSARPVPFAGWDWIRLCPGGNPLSCGW